MQPREPRQTRSAEIEENNQQVKEGCAKRSVQRVTPRTCLNLQWQLNHPPGSFHPSAKLSVFHHWHLGESSRGKKTFAPAKNAVIAKCDSEKIDSQISPRIADSINVIRPGKAESKATNCDARLCHRLRDRSFAIKRNAGVRMHKPKHVAGSCTCPGVHLCGSSTFALHHSQRQFVGKTRREFKSSIVALPVDHNHLGG